MPFDEDNAPPSIRDTLLSSIETLEVATPPADAPPLDTGDTADQIAAARARDDQGRFAPKEGDPAPAAAPIVTAAPVAAPAEPVKPSLTTWRKEYLPIQQKLADGLALTPDEARKLAQYNVERESQYSTGVSTYKAEAQQARHLQEAVNEFMPALQANNINPAQWIQNLGRAHHTLALGTPEQKLSMFANLAREYGVPLPAITQQQQGQLDPTVAVLMAELANVKQGVNHFTNWRQQQEEAAVQQEISKFSDTNQYPHFEQVRQSMIQLLESGVARNPDEAYTKAVRLDDNAWSDSQARQAATSTATQQASKATAIAKAKASSVQVRTATPSSTATAQAPQKDRRSAIEAAFEAADTGRV